ncbi:MAG: AEC family transporter [Pararhodobacter sp.]|nr:AEC family transporter [Pararhodobacter sp.]
MLEIFLTTAPLYLMILVGFASVRTGYIEAGHVGALSQFAFKVCLPVLIFMAIAMPRGDGSLNLSFLAAYLLGSMATMLLGYAATRLILRRPRPESWILAMGMSNSNSGYVGFPVASLFFGPEAAVVFAMTMLVENTVTLPFATIAATASGEKGANLRVLAVRALQAIIRNPLVIAVALALIVRAAGVPLTGAVEQSVRMLAAVAAPLALFVVGGTVARIPLTGHWRRTAAVTVGKLVVHPLLVTAMLFLVPGVPPALIPVGILFAAVPMLTIFPILAAPFGLGTVTATALLVTTAVSCVTVSLVLSMLPGV